MANKKKKPKAKHPILTVNVIVAVAIGDPSNNWDFTDPLDTAGKLATVRPYIKGLVDWLAAHSDPPTADDTLNVYSLGKNYIIRYRECEKKDLQNIPFGE